MVNVSNTPSSCFLHSTCVVNQAEGELFETPQYKGIIFTILLHLAFCVLSGGLTLRSGLMSVVDIFEEARLESENYCGSPSWIIVN